MDVHGVPANGVIDSGADITIMGAELFKRVASVSRMKSAFKKPNKTLYTYDYQPFSLDGYTMRTPVYVKMDAHDSLLYSEDQLGIIKCHPSVGADPHICSSTLC